MESILITGASGRLGKPLVEYLLNSHRYNLVLNYHSEGNIPYTISNDSHCKIVIGDCGDPEVVKELFSKNISTVIHLATPVNPSQFYGNWGDTCLSGAHSTFVLMDYLRHSSKKYHVVFPSSGGTIYALPLSKNSDGYSENDLAGGCTPYGIQKCFLENYFRLLTEVNPHISCNILRVSNPFGLMYTQGKKQGFIDIAVHKVRSNEPIEIWSDMSTVRDYIFLDDLNNAFEKAIYYKNKFEVFNIGSGKGTSILEVIQSIEELSEKKVPVITKKSNPDDIYPSCNFLSIKKAQQFLNWTPQLTFHEAMRKFWKSL